VQRSFLQPKTSCNWGICDAVIVGGADSLCRLTLNGFDALELVSDSICNPLSKNRKGINIGEGACLFLLTKEGCGIQFLGCGESSDAYHMSAPDPKGLGAEMSMKRALEDSGLSSLDMDYINLHGTGTKNNDSMESKAISRIFSSKPDIFCSSTKPYVGHMLGASGATEIGFCWLMFHEGDGSISPPPHYWDGCRDEALPQLRLAQSGDRLESKRRYAALSNSFAFGGNNCSVIIGKGF